MKAIQFKQFGEYSQLQLVDLPQPEAKDGQVLVRMTAAAINPLDNTVRLGYFPMAKQPPLVLGNEGAGIVVEPGNSELAVGTRVMFTGAYGVLHDGVWQEYMAAQPQELLPVPEGISDVEAAAVSTC